eukprot:7755876-Pyramimonas_sp.AAC.1
MPLLEKPKGGLRPILPPGSPVRLWERLRRGQADEFLERAPRRHWSFGNGTSSEVAIWKHSVLAEQASSTGKATAGFIWDGVKYYESFVLAWLRDRA